MIFLYLNSDKMGEGDPQLGKKLMRSFLSELATSGQTVDFIGCVNSGINLTTSGSEVLDSLKILQENGATIATCGTCLDFYNKRDALAIGVIGTMDKTVALMLNADKIIRPC